MTSLPTTFTTTGFHFTQLERQGDVVLLAKTRVTTKVKSYEVVIAQQLPAKVMPNGVYYEAREAMPRSEDWGRFGWSYPDLASAQAKFRQLVVLPVDGQSEVTPFTADAFPRPQAANAPVEAQKCRRLKRGGLQTTTGRRCADSQKPETASAAKSRFRTGRKIAAKH